jgi:hypothetical protein
VGHRAGLDAMVKINIPSPYQDLNPHHPALAQRYTTELFRLLKYVIYRKIL